MKPSEFELSLSVENYEKKTVANFRNNYVAENHIVSKLLKILIPNFITEIEDLNQDFVKISRPYLQYFLRNKREKCEYIFLRHPTLYTYVDVQPLSSSIKKCYKNIVVFV